MTFVCLLEEREREIRDSYACNILFMILKNDQCVKKKTADTQTKGWNSNSRSSNKTIVLFFKRMLNNCSLSKSSLTFFSCSQLILSVFFQRRKRTRKKYMNNRRRGRRRRKKTVGGTFFSFYIDNSINCT